MMTSESWYLHRTNSDCEACGDQESLRVLLTDLRTVVDDLGLDSGDACQSEIGKKAEVLLAPVTGLALPPAILLVPIGTVPICVLRFRSEQAGLPWD